MSGHLFGLVVERRSRVFVANCWGVVASRLPKVALSVCLSGWIATLGSAVADEWFQAETIDGDVKIGYGVAVGEVDGDGRPDLLLADKSEFVWYRNPGATGEPWTRHVLARQLTPSDNVCLAARDLDHDGRVELAVGANWNPGETDDVARSGAVFYLRRPDDPTQPWEAVPITPHDPTVHRMHWVRWGDGTYRLVVLPLHGRGNRNGEGRPVRAMAYEILPSDGTLVGAQTIHEEFHLTHNLDVVSPDDRTAESIWIAGREGLARVTQAVTDTVVAAAPGRGAGEVRHARIRGTGTELVTIEPMHGFEVVYYQQAEDGLWQREVLDASLNQGHALAAADFLGLGRDQVVAGWRNPNADGRVGIRLYVPNPDRSDWTTHVVDDNHMACEDLRVADLNGDGRLDVVAAGRATNNLIVYWNQGAGRETPRDEAGPSAH